MKLKQLNRTRGSAQVRRKTAAQLRLELIARIATETRAWAVKTNKDMDLGFNDTLQGMCAIAAARLFLNLQKSQIKCKLVANNEHCFVLCDDVVVDVTATQFGHKEVVVRDVKLVEKIRYWYRKHEFDSVDDLAKWQTDTRWPPNQIVDC